MRESLLYGRASHGLVVRHFSFKALVVLLVAAVLAAPLAAQESSPSASTKDQPVGCHEDGPMVPTPEPTSHQCCQSGHDTPFLLASTSRPSLEVSSLIQLPQGTVVAVLHSLPNLVIVSGDPPTLSPLRV